MSGDRDPGDGTTSGVGGTPPDALGYAAAVAELEQILAELESDEVDVDVLAAQVRRAATLLEACRSRIDAARFEVTKVVADLAGPEVGAGADGVDDVLAAPPPVDDLGAGDDGRDGVAGG